MTFPYVPVPTILPATITLPQDVIDDVVVGTVNPPFAALANAVAYINRLGTQAARYQIDPGSVGNGDPCLLTAFFEGPGISSTADTISVTDGGIYVGLLDARVTCGDTTDGIEVSFALEAAGPTVSPTILHAAMRRYSTTAGQAFQVPGNGLNVIDALSTIQLINSTSTTIVIVTPSVLSIFRLNSDTP